MCLMKLHYRNKDGQSAEIENVVSVRSTKQGLDVETLLDGTIQLDQCQITIIDCSQGRIETASIASISKGETSHV